MIRPGPSLARAALLYGAMWLGANPALAGGLDAAERAELQAMRTGTMSNLVLHEEPYPPIEESWADEHGNPVSLEDYAGEVVVMNFWATWCPPCVAEMPSLDRLAGRMKDRGLAVVPVSIDRDASRIEEFFRGIGIENLDVHHDRSRAVSRRAAVLGLPATIILDPEGREVARLVGDAEWDSPEAVALLERLIEFTADDVLQSTEAPAPHPQG